MYLHASLKLVPRGWIFGTIGPRPEALAESALLIQEKREKFLCLHVGILHMRRQA
jgi:hypothetical protein